MSGHDSTLIDDESRWITPEEIYNYSFTSFREEFQKAYRVEKLRIEIAERFIGRISSGNSYIPESIIDSYIDKRSTLEAANLAGGNKVSQLKTVYREMGMKAAHITTYVRNKRKLKELDRIVRDKIFEKRSNK